MHRFARDLEVDPRIAYRLLAERSHKACVVRSIQEPGTRPAILVGTQEIAGRLLVSFSDNGAALGGEDVKQVYAALQAGLVEETRRALVAQGTEVAHGMIGPLGLAMLGSFLLADMVTIKTRGSTDTGTRFVCTSATYTTEPYQIPRAGTVIQLRVRKEREAVADLVVLRETLAQLKQLSPITLGMEPTAINA